MDAGFVSDCIWGFLVAGPMNWACILGPLEKQGTSYLNQKCALAFTCINHFGKQVSLKMFSNLLANLFLAEIPSI